MQNKRLEVNLKKNQVDIFSKTCNTIISYRVKEQYNGLTFFRTCKIPQKKIYISSNKRRPQISAHPKAIISNSTPPPPWISARADIIFKKAKEGGHYSI